MWVLQSLFLSVPAALFVIVVLPFVRPKLGHACAQAARWGITVGLAAFLLGFVGPIVLTPGANQGPLLGIFFTGPLGFVVGTGFGFIRGLRRPPTPPPPGPEPTGVDQVFE